MAEPPVFDTSDIAFPCETSDLDHESFFVNESIEEIPEPNMFLISSDTENLRDSADVISSVSKHQGPSRQESSSDRGVENLDEEYSAGHLTSLNLHHHSATEDRSNGYSHSRPKLSQHEPQHKPHNAAYRSSEESRWIDDTAKEDSRHQEVATAAGEQYVGVMESTQRKQTFGSSTSQTHITQQDKMSRNQQYILPGLISAAYDRMNYCKSGLSFGTPTPRPYTPMSSSISSRMQEESGFSLGKEANLERQDVRAAMAAQRPARLRYSKGAAPSKYCHVCGRSAKTVSVALCGNNKLGLCRKVVCDKCLIMHHFGDYRTAKNPDSSWVCTHCRGDCPPRARCHQYQRNNMRRRNRNQLGSNNARMMDDESSSRMRALSQSESVSSAKDFVQRREQEAASCRLTEGTLTDVCLDAKDDIRNDDKTSSQNDEISPTNIMHGALTGFQLSRGKSATSENVDDETSTYEPFQFI